MGLGSEYSYFSFRRKFINLKHSGPKKVHQQRSYGHNAEFDFVWWPKKLKWSNSRIFRKKKQNTKIIK